LREAAGKGGHESLAGEHDALDFNVSCGRAAGKICVAEEAVQVGRNFFQGEVVITVAVSAATFVKGHSLQLLFGERSGTAAGKKDGKNE